MKDNFNFVVVVNPQITIGDINGNVGLTSLLFILIVCLVLILSIIKKSTVKRCHFQFPYYGYSCS